MKSEAPPTIRDLYPHLDDEQLAQAEDNLRRYVALVLCVFDRVAWESKAPSANLTPCTGTLPCTPPDSASS